MSEASRVTSGTPPRPAALEPVTRAEVGALALILVVGVFLRSYRLTELPPGLHQDEAVYALHSLTVALGQLRIYFGEREPLFMYLVAGSSLLLGPTTLALRLTAAVVGSLAVLTTYLAARAMLGRLVALLAGATLAVALWPVMISRVGFRAGTLPLLETAALYFLWVGWRRGSIWRSLIGGVLLGGTLYTYIASRVFPLVVGACLLVQLLTDRDLRRRWRAVALSLLAALAAFAPLGYYFVRHPEVFLGRPAQVSAVDAPLGGLLSNAVRTLGMFFVAGDANWRHNLSGEPALLLPVAAVMVLGYGLALARLRSPAHLFLVLWLPAALVPSMLSVDAPHYLRTIGAAPAAALAVGVGLASLARWASAGLARLGRPSPRLVAALALALALAPAVTTYRDYFLVWAARPEAARAFNVGLAAAGEYLASSDAWRAGRGAVYVTDRFYADRASLTFFLWPHLTDAERLGWSETDLRVKWFDEESTLPLPASGEALYVLDADPARPGGAARLAALGVADEVVTAPPLGLPAFTRYQLDAALGQPARELSAKGEAGLDLVGYRLPGPTPSGERATVALYWRVTGAPPGAAPSVFCQLVDDAGRTLAQADQVLGYDPARWAPGDTIVTWHSLAIPAGLPPGGYMAEVGLYDKASGRRQSLRLLDRVDSKALAGPVEVTRGAADPSAVHPAHRTDSRLAPELRLIGFDRGDGPVAPGARLPITLYWEALATPREYELELGLEAADGKLTSVSRVRPTRGRLPIEGWRPGEVVRDDLTLRVDPATPAGRYGAVVRVLAAGAETGRALLGELEVVGQPRVFDPPTPQHSVEYGFGESAALVGYDLAAETVRPGGSVKLTLYWRATGETPTAYTVFTHLLDTGERVWGQQDNQPARGSRPTTGWVPGEYVADEYAVPVAADAPPGRYRVEVGMYDASTGARLPVRDSHGEAAGDRVVLESEVLVQP